MIRSASRIRHFSNCPKSTRRRPLVLESLEDRRVLSTVTLNTDTGAAGELRTAIANAVPGETIDFNLASGSESINLALGQLVINKALIIDGNNTAGSGNNVTIHGGGTSRVLNVDDGSAAQVDVTIRFLNISGGNVLLDPNSTVGGGIRNTENLRLETSTVSGSTAEFGGGIGNNGGTVNLISSTVENNSAIFRGGGVYNNSGGSFTIRQSSLLLNKADNNTIYSAVGAGGSNFGTGSVMSVIDSTITGNDVSHDDTTYPASGLGGGFANDEFGQLTIQNSNITVNSADYGGGIWTDDEATTNVIQDSNVDANTAAQRGGGLFGTDGAVISVRYSSLSGNSTTVTGTGDGGAVFVSNRAQLTIEHGTVSNNYALDRGGAIYASNFGAAPGVNVTITDSTLSGNTAQNLGGGLNIGQSVIVSIEDSTLSNNIAGVDGGALRASAFSTTYESMITINRSMITGNTASDDAGAIEGRGGVRMYIYDSMIRENVAPSTGSRGGGFYVRGEGTSPVGFYMTMRGSVVSGNSAGDDGGGIHVGRQATVLIDDTQIVGNTADGSGTSRGGGIRLSFSDVYGTTTSIRDSVIRGNSASSSGGGMSISQSVVATVENSTFANNSTGSAGGGIVNYSRGDLKFRRGTISGNTAVNTGGGIDTTTASLVMQQSTVSGNTSTGTGGGIYLDIDYNLAGNYALNIEGTTVAFNSTVSNGGGIYAGLYADTTLSGSIVSGNMAAFGNDLYESGVIVPSFNLIGDNAGSPLGEANPDANGNIIGGSVGGIVNPMLGLLQANGGPTQTHALMVGSPAIDRGDPAILAGTTTDQRGLERVTDGDAVPGARADMGSYEFGSVSLPSGDFDNNGMWECADIDALVQAIVAGTNNPAFDMTGDGLVNLNDITNAASGWLRVAGEINLGPGKSYLIGDANLDGIVDGQDFILWNSNKFTSTPQWCKADFNADGVVDGQDFISWNQNKFMSSDAILGSGESALDQIQSSAQRGINDKLVEDVENTKFEFADAAGQFSEMNLAGRGRLKQVAPVASILQSDSPVIAAETAAFNATTVESIKSQPAVLAPPTSIRIKQISDHHGRKSPPASGFSVSQVDDVFAQLGCG